jgi:hypothetical protein
MRKFIVGICSLIFIISVVLS